MLAAITATWMNWNLKADDKLAGCWPPSRLVHWWYNVSGQRSIGSISEMLIAMLFAIEASNLMLQAACLGLPSSVRAPTYPPRPTHSSRLIGRTADKRTKLASVSGH